MTATPTETLITVFGGSGFLGRHVVRALAKRGYRIRVAVRRPDLAFHLQPAGRVGQIHAVQANLRHPGSVNAAVRDADAVVNLVGILFERGRQRFDTVQAFGAEACALSAAAHGAQLVHVSAIGAGEQSRSHYARSKAAGEKLVRAAMADAVILRVVDKFLLQLEGQLGEKKVEVTFTDGLRRQLAKKGFDPLMGARPMSRLIQDLIRKALADELLFGRLVTGGRVTVDMDDKEQVKLEFVEGDATPPAAPPETVEVD